MDPITSTIQRSRLETLSVSDYGQYRKTCTSKLLQLRRKLRIVTPKGRKYEPKALEKLYLADSDRSTLWQEYLIFTSERAWAHAMFMKSVQADETGDSTLAGATRAHIISRLVKASKNATHLIALSQQGSDTETRIAAAAYKKSLEGSAAFESQQWERCLSTFSEAQVIYTALGDSKKSTAYSDWISENIEPSIRYAAYQQRLPRTLGVPKIVNRFVPRDSEHVQEALKVSPTAIPEEKTSDEKTVQATDPQDLPTSISWRGRTVKLEDARVAQALAAVKLAEDEIKEVVAGQSPPQEKAAAFEKVLVPSQDAVDSTKTAIDELTAEGVAPSDARMQSLQITSTAVNYDLIGWRIGRNRVLCGADDGASFEPEPPRKPRSRKAGKTEESAEPKEVKEGVGRKLARLRERVVLYDATLQSIDAIRELPGVPGDSGLLKKLVSRKGYFAALRSIAIARSHALQGNNQNALALFARAAQHASVMDTFDDEEPAAKSGLPRHFLLSSQAKSLQKLTDTLVLRFHALVEMDNLENEAVKAEKAKATWAAPMIERMDEYPAGGADLHNLVTYPPKLRPVPVKPIFLDLAWNYIEYPGQTKVIAQNASTAVVSEEEEQPAAKRGWFGFGRK